MNMLIRCLILILVLTPAATLLAQDKYGDATIHEGRMILLRSGQRMSYTARDGITAVHVKDVIRLGKNSRVTLETRENATITLGSNAVMQVEPWKARKQTGFFRALFGRVRAKIVGLTGGERFNVRTATATIGVKGSGYDAGVTSNGNTVTACTDDECFLQGNTGPDRNFQPGFASVVLGGQQATPPVPTPPEVSRAFSDEGEGLSNPPPGSPAARSLPGEEGLIRAGIVTQEEIDKSKEEKSDLDEELDESDDGEDEDEDDGLVIDEPVFNLDDAVQESKSFTIDLDVNFEN